MKRLVITLLCQFIAIVTYSQVKPAAVTEKHLKVITYNIWNGYDWGKDFDRRNRTTQWIADQQPSIVALQELCKYTGEKLEKDAQVWGHEYSVLLKTTGYSVGLTSKWPIEIKEKIRKDMHHGALHCQTNGIDVFVIHFSPSSYLKRREEASIILDRLEKVRENNGKYMVLGDFNACSPIDADLYDPDGPLLTRMHESNKGNPEKGNLLNGEIEYGVLSSFLALPLLDVCQPFTQGINERGSFPGQILRDENNRTEEEFKELLERIDFILVSPELRMKCTSAKVCNEEENYYLSDHYPVMAEFAF